MTNAKNVAATTKTRSMSDTVRHDVNVAGALAPTIVPIKPNTNAAARALNAPTKLALQSTGQGRFCMELACPLDRSRKRRYALLPARRAPHRVELLTFRAFDELQHETLAR